MEHWLWIILAALFSGLIAGDRITPEEDEVSKREGESVSLRCGYETTSDYVNLYWYKHSDLQAPQFILNDERYESQTSRTSAELTIRRLTLTDTALYYCALGLQTLGLRFGKPIRLTVTPADPNGVKPTLFVLSPLLPEGRDRTGPEVCLATGFRPKGSDMVLNVEGGGPLSVPTRDAVLSPKKKTYFYAGFSDQKIRSCELLGSVSNNDTGDLCTNIQPTGSPNTHQPGSQTEPGPQAELESQAEPGSQAELNFYLLVMNAVRVIFTKTLAFNTLLTIRAVLV